jgi:hypothetical protein
MGERYAVKVLVGIPEGKRPLGRHWSNGRIVLRWIFKKWDAGVEWIDVAQDRDRWWWALVIGVMNVLVPRNARNFLNSWETVSFSKRALLHEVRHLHIVPFLHASIYMRITFFIIIRLLSGRFGVWFSARSKDVFLLKTYPDSCSLRLTMSFTGE